MQNNEHISKETNNDGNIMDKIGSVQGTNKGTNEDRNVTNKKESIKTTDEHNKCITRTSL